MSRDFSSFKIELNCTQCTVQPYSFFYSNFAKFIRLRAAKLFWNEIDSVQSDEDFALYHGVILIGLLHIKDMQHDFTV